MRQGSGPSASPILRALLALALLLAPGPAGHAADPVPYSVAIAPSGLEELDRAAAAVSLLETLRERSPASPLTLVARARGDAERFTQALQSLGHYAGQVSITILGAPFDSPDLPGRLEALPEGSPVTVAVRIDPGPEFTLRRIAVEGEVPAAARAALNLSAGMPARADAVLAARERLLAALRAEGFARAEIDPPDAAFDREALALDIGLRVRTGPRVTIGPIAIAGLERLREEAVRRRLMLRPGERYAPERLEAARRDLAGFGPVGNVRLVEAEQPAADGTLPLTIEVAERKPRAIEVSAGWTTDLGGRTAVQWTHRNLFGSGERLVLSAAVTGLGGSAVRAPGYLANTALTLPDQWARDQDLTLAVGAERAHLRAYDRTALTASATLRRKLSGGFSASLGLAAQQARITQEGQIYDFTLLQLPATLALDTTDSPFDPTSGLRGGVTVTPSLSLGRPGTRSFVTAQAAAATYLDVGRALGAAPGRSVLALRGLVGMTHGADLFDLPPDQRFYAGGSATVRGYRYQSIGRSFASGRPTGGTAVNTASAEFRQRLGDSWGVVAFIDAGQLSAGGVPFTGEPRIGAGIGVRYYTAIGPVRVDVAVPLVRQRGTDPFQLYIGIGQAF